MIHIVADSTSDLSRELIEKHHISILPLHVILDDKEYRDGVDITPADIYKWSDEVKRTPKTSAAGIEEVTEVFTRLTENGDEIIVLPISSQMSTTLNVMNMVADDLNLRDRVSIVDSENLSTGIGLLVMEAAIMAENGASRDEIVARLVELRPRVRASFVIDTLTYLYRGGRCNSLSAIFGSVLKLHPRIDVIHGAMTAGERYRGKFSAVTLKYVTDMEDRLLKAKKDRVFLTHSEADPDTVESVRKYLESLNYFDEIIETRAGGVISSHCGPGTLGVLFIDGE